MTEIAPPQIPPARPSDGELREILLRSAIEAIRAGGPGVSMDEIAAAGGVTKPTLYRIFGSKPGLYRAIADWFIGDIAAAVAVNLRDSLALRDFIHLTVDAVLSRVGADVEIYHFLMRRARVELFRSDADEDFLRIMSGLTTAMIEDRISRTDFDPTPAPIWAHGVVGMINGAADWWVDHQEVPREEVVDQISEILWNGFRPFSDKARPDP